MSDPYAADKISLNSPALHGAAATPDDSTDLPTVSRAIYVGTAGSIRIILAGDTEAVTLSTASAGQILPLRVKRVLSTGTTAANLIALF